LIALICIAGPIPACQRASPSREQAARHYEVRGIIRGLAPDHTSVDVEHEDIRGFMPSMTMPLSVHDQKEIVDLKLGDGIAFRLNVTDQDVWIDQVRKIPANDVHLPSPTPAATTSPHSFSRLREGDAMPWFRLTTQDGEQITLETFRGHPFVLTFVFTRCPLPTFCPRMSQNFSELQKAIKKDEGGLERTRLLSITIDPSFDTPKVLKQYAAYQKADPDVWTFATGQPSQIDELTHLFSVYVQTEGGTISHGLATALINKGGEIEKIWRGNAWTPAEVIQEISAQR
jgi:protein SCO1/2